MAAQVPSDAKPVSPAESAPAGAKDVLLPVPSDPALHPDQGDNAKASPAVGGPPKPSETKPPSHRRRKWLLLAGAAVGLAVAGYFLIPWVITALNTVSTDDAYVNGHVTFVAPRVAGQVSKVWWTTTTA